MEAHKTWEPYDPTWLVELAREQHPDKPWLADALAACTRCRCGSAAYIHFVNNERPNQAGSEWQFDTNLELQSPTEGEIILDVLTGQRVGGLELINKIEM